MFIYLYHRVLELTHGKFRTVKNTPTETWKRHPSHLVEVLLHFTCISTSVLSLSVPFFLSISFYLSLFPISPSLSISIYTLSSPLSSDSISSLLFTSFSLPTSLPHSLIDALPLHILTFPSSNSLLNFHSVGSEPICLHLKPLFNHVGVFVP